MPGRFSFVAGLVAGTALAAPLAAQSVQYRSASGVEYRSQGDTGAIARADQALAADPRNPALLLQLGLAQAGVRQYREAIRSFTRGLELAPRDPMLLRWRGHRYLSTRNFDRALDDLTRASRLDSTNYGAWYHLGIVKFARGDFAGAADAFSQAQRRAPDAAELAGSTDWLWMALSRAGRTAEASAMLARRPDSLRADNAYTRRLQLYRGEIRSDQVFRASDTADVHVATLSYGLGNWYVLRGDTARARLWFERSIASGGWPAFGFILSEIELARPAPLGGGTDPGLVRLEEELERLSTIAQGRVGVGIIHLESGKELFLNADEPFPMASTYKVPIALALFDLVDRGRIRLDSMVTITAEDLHPGSGEITHLLNDPGVALSLLNLTELMLLISDNTATDLVLRTVGAGAAVNARLTALGIGGISVDRPTLDLIADAVGSKVSTWMYGRGFEPLPAASADSIRGAARTAFYRDRRDTATPRGMASLLAKLWRGETLSPASTAQLLDIMYRCETGLLRIRGMLPPGIRVAHKTGTLGLGVTNDLGIIELPNRAGHVVLAVFVKEARASAENRERTIAQVARAVYDYFVFSGVSSAR